MIDDINAKFSISALNLFSETIYMFQCNDTCVNYYGKDSNLR